MFNTKLIQLNGSNLCIALEKSADTPPLWRHFGTKLEPHAITWRADDARPHPPTILDGDPPFTAFSTHGFGWFHQPALVGSRPGEVGDIDWAQNFHLDELSVDNHSITMKLSDEQAELGAILNYTIDPASDVVTMWAELENRGATPFRVDWLAAAAVPLPPDADRVLGFSGRWTLEFLEKREMLGSATWRRDNRRGRTSHDSFPGVMVGSSLADDAGAVYGAHLGWSGNHTIIIEPMTDGRRQLQLGEWLAPGEVVLAPDQRYRTPCAFLSYSEHGLNGLSAQFHRFVRANVLRWPRQHMQPRPVILNTWEATYCDHDLEGLKELASAGAQIGIERFVLDDGWFHRRDSDRAGLGDWWPDANKYPQGLTPLIHHVRGLGMEFGLWIEPEMVNQDSELYRARPDWILQLDGRPLVTGRNQLVLDLTEPDVPEYIFKHISALLREHSISYLKWDMNRDLATAGHRGIPAYRRQTHAFYALLDRLRTAFPSVEIESCASGGGRADYGVLARMHRVWASDCNDALTRIGIQRGFLRFFPPELMGAHIGADCSHTTGRRHTLAFRAAVALFGHLGVEIDPRAAPADEIKALMRWIAIYKEWRPVLHAGTLHQGHVGEALSWTQVVAEDGNASLLAVYRLCEDDARYATPLKINGLRRDIAYRMQMLYAPVAPHFVKPTDMFTTMQNEGVVISGASLLDFGMPLPPMPPESAVVISITSA
ncbi:alpha-galactosidase [Burkholderia mayonis]|uniref:Alpha-galactosidase n=1 Tax=Burkholderia mayonis TaxID=1385591 RepID=A0A1B4FE30_9BURK|nr:alpha-galactosidase [Burkholderia mayonis]AOJ01907.1 alpha-galactosidase [Burkholderia mayonis]KVE46048.1 alpha-galactosidase [Burkholderia mayonis]